MSLLLLFRKRTSAPVAGSPATATVVCRQMAPTQVCRRRDPIVTCRQLSPAITCARRP